MKKNKKAFTLVELLVVIAIIAILAVVSIVGYTAFTQKARDAAAKEELSQFISLLIVDDIENDKIEITTGDSGCLTYSSTEEVTAPDDDAIRGLLSEEAVNEIKGLQGKFSGVSTSAGETGSYTVTVTTITYTLNGGTATYSFATQTYNS